MKKTVLHLLSIAACAAALSACMGGGGKQAQNTEAEAETEATAVVDENVVVLFDGTSTEGWRGYDKTGLPARWSIDEGALKISGSGTGEGQSGEGGDIIFAAQKFVNFELTFEWKVSKGANSGVFFYAKELPGRPIYISSPEFQVLDNINHPDAKLGKDGNRQSASLYDMIPAVPQNAKPFGEWNTGGIMVYKGTVVHYQNGETVLEYHLWTPEWTALINSGKFRDGNQNWPDSFELLTAKLGKDDEGNPVGGYIGLQDHGDDVWFRNIKVKVLE